MGIWQRHGRCKDCIGSGITGFGSDVSLHPIRELAAEELIHLLLDSGFCSQAFVGRDLFLAQSQTASC